MVISLALHWLLFVMLNITFHSFRHVQKARGGGGALGYFLGGYVLPGTPNWPPRSKKTFP